ncbi:MAG: tetratricopeptide repeat protein [Bacteroidetes bacterium]|nr:tetratricopeptide repeat protein [Bacteroidota bacterium]
MQRIEDCEFDEIPLVADSIFAFIKLHETDKSIPERDLQILKATTYNDLGYYYNESNIHTKGLQHYLLAYSIHSKWNSTGGVAVALNNIGMVYKDQGDLKKAQEYILRSIKYNEQLGNLMEVAAAYDNIGNIYYMQDELELAQQFFRKSLEISTKENHKKEMAFGLNNIASTYVEQEKYDTALLYFKKSLAIRIQLKNVALTPIYNNMAFMHRRLGHYDKAMEYYKLAITTVKSEKDLGLGASYLGIANILHDTNKDDEAMDYAKKSYAIYKESDMMENMANASILLHQLYAAKKDFSNAYFFLKQYTINHDSLVNQKNKKAVYKQQLQFEYGKKAFADSLKTVEERKVVDAQLKQEKTQRFALYGGLALVAMFGLFVFNRLKVTQKQKNIIEIKEKETNHQKQLVEEKQKEIIDSINYAKRIQSTLMASEQSLSKNLKEHFVLFKPKDIVSGDFYWTTQKGHLFYLACCDSTGHGVPGAFMSLLNIGFLSEAIKEKNMEDPGDVFNYVRHRLVETISNEDQKDGFDGIIICFNQLTLQISYAAANNNPVLIGSSLSPLEGAGRRPGDVELTDLPYDKMPVGKGETEESFKTYEINANEGDVLYLFTDGYPDQFGGPKGKKFKYKQLGELLVSIHQQNMATQKEKLLTDFNNWKGNLEQVDDVCIIGLKI